MVLWLTVIMSPISNFSTSLMDENNDHLISKKKKQILLEDLFDIEFSKESFLYFEIQTKVLIVTKESRVI